MSDHERTKEERGQSSRKRGKESKESRNIVILTLIICYSILVSYQ